MSADPSYVLHYYTLCKTYMKTQVANWRVNSYNLQSMLNYSRDNYNHGDILLVSLHVIFVESVRTENPLLKCKAHEQRLLICGSLLSK